jgi:hypothetical protein
MMSLGKADKNTKIAVWKQHFLSFLAVSKQQNGYFNRKV